MSTSEGRLDKAEHARIFTDKVVPRSRLRSTTSQETPHAIITAGQPGAGKSSLVEMADAELGRNTVVVDPDDLRRLHPDFRRLHQTYPYTWSSLTNHDAGGWASKLRDAAVEGRRNLIIDTTLGDADAAIRNIARLKSRGYELEVRVVAAHRLESELGIEQRFTDSMREKGYGRYVPPDFHARVYSSLPANLDKVFEQTGVRTRIFDREGRELYDSRTSPMKPSIALERIQEARMKDPAVTRETARRWRTQQAAYDGLTEWLEHSPAVSTSTAKNASAQHQAMQVDVRVRYRVSDIGTIDHGVRVPGLLLRSAGGVALAHDAFTTAQASKRLLAQGNRVGEASQTLHFAGRNLGMAGGAVMGAKLGAMAGIEAGPGVVLTGLAGGIVGAVVGSRLMDVVDRARIYSQRDAAGDTWHLDPGQPARGWQRSVSTGEIDPQVPSWMTGAPTYTWQTQHADPALADRLDYQASGTAVALAMANAPTPRNPYRQDIEGGDVPSGKTATEWVRNGADRQWQRLVYGPDLRMGGRIETATPERAARLERAAQGVIDANAAGTPKAMAQRYQAAYERNGWERHGPLHEAVKPALESPGLPASDGREYRRGQDGQWRARAWHGGMVEAQGNVRDELDGLQQRLQPAAPSRGHRQEHSSADPQPRQTDAHAFAERVRRMLAAADAEDWASFCQDVQALAQRPAALKLQADAQAAADRAAQQQALLAPQAAAETQRLTTMERAGPVMRL